MQSAIAKKHTLEPGTHQPCTQSLEKVNLDNSKSNNNQSNNIQRLKPDKLRSSTSTQTTTPSQNIMLQKSWKKAQKSFLKLDLKLFSGFKHRWSSKQALKLSDPFKANFKARFFCQGLIPAPSALVSNSSKADSRNGWLLIENIFGQTRPSRSTINHFVSLLWKSSKRGREPVHCLYTQQLQPKMSKIASSGPA